MIRLGPSRPLMALSLCLGTVLGALWPCRPVAALNQRAYVADPTNGILRVIEGTTEIIIPAPGFPVGQKPSDVAVDPAGTRVYVTSPTDGKITVVDPVMGVLGTVADPDSKLNAPTYLAIAPEGD